MLSKAACMGDMQAFDLIKAAKDQEVCKQRGRQIKPWDEELWNKSVVQIAISMVYQKFTKVNGLKQVLLSTADKIIVESTDDDKNWGSGFNIGHEFEKVPSEWAKNEGYNLLGYALMKAREMIRDKEQEDAEMEQIQ